MRKLLLIILCTILILPVFAQETVLQAGVAVSEVPESFFGSWSITGKLDETNNRSIFKPQSKDFWTLTRSEDFITLSNNLTGANATITVDAVEGNVVVFTRKVSYDNKKLTDSVTLRIDNKKFSGINTLKVESFSLIDGHLMKTDTATYLINGEKIAN